MRFSGIDGLSGRQHRQKLICELLSRFGDRPLATIELVVVPQVIDQWLPRSDVPNEIIPEKIRTRLADPNAHKSAPIEALLGAGVWAAVILDGGCTNALGIAFQPTELGWLVFGGGIRSHGKITMGAVTNEELDTHLAPLLQRFWEMEEISSVRVRTIEQEQCEDIFMRTHQRLADGHYQVDLPMRNDFEQLGSSRAVALHRFHQLERRLQRDPELNQKYCEAMTELQQEGHMWLADRPPSTPCYYIPHHAVLKKFRIVFDASCRTDRCSSLNDATLVGEGRIRLW